MKITLIREVYTAKSTIGKLYIDGVFQCVTLEDVVRANGAKKVKDATAIPAGAYKVIVDFSHRFQQLMPLYIDVPGYSGVRLHFGNTALDTSGCTLVGLEAGKDVIYHSRDAFNKVFPKIKAAYDANQHITIAITDTNQK